MAATSCRRGGEAHGWLHTRHYGPTWTARTHTIFGALASTLIKPALLCAAGNAVHSTESHHGDRAGAAWFNYLIGKMWADYSSMCVKVTKSGLSAYRSRHTVSFSCSSSSAMLDEADAPGAGRPSIADNNGGYAPPGGKPLLGNLRWSLRFRSAARGVVLVNLGFTDMIAGPGGYAPRPQQDGYGAPQQHWQQSTTSYAQPAVPAYQQHQSLHGGAQDPYHQQSRPPPPYNQQQPPPKRQQTSPPQYNQCQAQRQNQYAQYAQHGGGQPQQINHDYGQSAWQQQPQHQPYGHAPHQPHYTGQGAIQRDSNSSYTPIGTLTPYVNRWKIKGRVLNKSKRNYSNARGDGKLFNIEVVDRTGEIKITGFNEQCDAFFDRITVGHCYAISGGQLKGVDKRYATGMLWAGCPICRHPRKRTWYFTHHTHHVPLLRYNKLSHPFEITLNRGCTIEESDDTDDIPKQQFNFVPLDRVEVRCMVALAVKLPEFRPSLQAPPADDARRCPCGCLGHYLAMR
eukprot:scaffold290604_cov35-Tisochrysis_lutea.AAC.3